MDSAPTQAVPVSEVAPVPAVSSPSVVVDSNHIPFYKKWNFWIFVVFMTVLGIILFFWFKPYFYSSFDATVEQQGEVIRAHVKRLVAPTTGFVVVQEDVAGLPGILIEVSRMVVPDTYKDFYIDFKYDETFTYEHYVQLLASQSVYITFYEDVDKNGTFDPLVDINIPKDVFGRTMQLKVFAGASQ